MLSFSPSRTSKSGNNEDAHFAASSLTKSNLLLLYRRHAMPLSREKDVPLLVTRMITVMNCRGWNGFICAPVTSSEVPWSLL